MLSALSRQLSVVSFHRPRPGYRPKDGREPGAPTSAILAVEKVAHCAPASFVGLFQRLTLVGVHGLLRLRAGVFGFAARGTTVGEAGLSGFSSNSSEQTAQILMGKAIRKNDTTHRISLEAGCATSAPLTKVDTTGDCRDGIVIARPIQIRLRANVGSLYISQNNLSDRRCT